MIPAELWEVAASPVGWAAAFVLGCLFGSFANVCIYRWPPTEDHPRGRSVVKPGSHCFDCGAAVRPIDNVPILSYLWLRGRCRVCKTEFSARYVFVEAAAGMLFAATLYYCTVVYPVGLPWERLLRFGIYAALLFVLLVIFFIDLDHKLILDKITFPSIPIFYGLGLLLPENDWQQGLIGAAVGYGVVRLIADGYRLLLKRDGMGYGDGKLLALLGAMFGWKVVFASLFVGSLVGTVVCVPLLLWSQRKGAGDDQGVQAEGEEALAPPEQPGDVSVGEDAGETTPDADEPAVEPDEPSLGQVEVPFGPFLIVGALVYLYLSPWLQISFRGIW